MERSWSPCCQTPKHAFLPISNTRTHYNTSSLHTHTQTYLRKSWSWEVKLWPTTVAESMLPALLDLPFAHLLIKLLRQTWTDHCYSVFVPFVWLSLSQGSRMTCFFVPNAVEHKTILCIVYTMTHWTGMSYQQSHSIEDITSVRNGGHTIEKTQRQKNSTRTEK